jgi:hypothetical protein
MAAMLKNNKMAAMLVPNPMRFEMTNEILLLKYHRPPCKSRIDVMFGIKIIISAQETFPKHFNSAVN